MRRIEVTLTNPVYRDLERLARQAGLGIGEFIHRSLGRIAADQNAPVVRYKGDMPNGFGRIAVRIARTRAGDRRYCCFRNSSTILAMRS